MRRLTRASQFIQDNAEQFNRLQDMVFAPQAAASAAGESFAPAAPSPLVSRYTPPLASFFVAAVPDAHVEGPAGVVFDSQRRLYAPAGTFVAAGAVQPAGPDAALDGAPTQSFALLATAIQTYGWMYHHWVAETLPKLVLLRSALPALLSGATWNASDLRLLLWGQPWEGEWLDLLRLPREAAVTYDSGTRYSARTLLLPSPVPAITPPAEALRATREAVLFALQAPRGGERDLLVWVSRTGERTRAVANERQLLGALQAAFPTLRVALHSRKLSASASATLFSRAAAVVGPHGAGLSHILFCAPGTAVVELVFMHSPPMMFWHMAAALELRYAMAPQPRSFWCVAHAFWSLRSCACADACRARGQSAKLVDVEEVLALLRRMLPAAAAASLNASAATCAAGQFAAADGSCAACAPGSYAPDGWPRRACVPCQPGRVAPKGGSTFCATCPDGTRAVDRIRCESCPSGSLRCALLICSAHRRCTLSQCLQCRNALR